MKASIVELPLSDLRTPLVAGDSNEFNRQRIMYPRHEIEGTAWWVRDRDLRYFNLIRLKIIGFHFEGVRFGDTSLEDTIFENCTFEGCTFEGNNVSRLRLRRCSVKACSFAGIHFKDTQVALTTFSERTAFRGCNLSGIMDAHQAYWLDVRVDSRPQLALLKRLTSKGMRLTTTERKKPVKAPKSKRRR
jgi:hypothetical protein